MIALQLITLALAVTRLTWLITRDGITQPIRERIWGHSDVDTGFLGGIVDCPDCCGVWVALSVSTAWWQWPHQTLDVATVFALSLIPMIFARKVL